MVEGAGDTGRSTGGLFLGAALCMAPVKMHNRSFCVFTHVEGFACLTALYVQERTRKQAVRWVKRWVAYNFPAKRCVTKRCYRTSAVCPHKTTFRNRVRSV